MQIKSLSLRHFRNYQSLDLSFGDGLTILTGENAQGKTNLLEAIFLLSLVKSHRTNKELDFIQWDAAYASIKGIIHQNNFDIPLELKISPKGKVALVNHVEQSKLSHFIGNFNVVLFSPEDMDLIKGSPALRRRYLDIEIGQTHRIYLNDMQLYNRLLKQRNQYLKQYGHSVQFDLTYFEVLTEQLIEKAVSIIQSRVKFVDQLNEMAQPIHFNLSNERDHLKVKYVSGTSKLDYSQLDTLNQQFKIAFEQVRQREKETGITVIGPHRDDIHFFINDQVAQQFASQGQQRTIVLSLKLAEIEWIYQVKNDYPVLLLDDVLSELDDERQHLLMTKIENKVQTFLTTATIKGLALDRLSNKQLFYIENGTVCPYELNE